MRTPRISTDSTPPSAPSPRAWRSLTQIAGTRTDRNDRPMEPQVMKKVTVETFGEEYPEPKKR